MSSFNAYLKQFPHYTSEVYESLHPFLIKKTVSSGDFLLRHGKVSKSIAFIERGLLRQYYLKDGKEITNCFCRENSITTSYKSLITQQESHIAIQALEESKLILLSYDKLQELFDKYLFWQQVGRIAAENEYMISESHTNFLKDLSATERYLHILHNDKDLYQRVSLNHLASYLQISPETLSRIRKKISGT